MDHSIVSTPSFQRLHEGWLLQYGYKHACVCIVKALTMPDVAHSPWKTNVIAHIYL